MSERLVRIPLRPPPAVEADREGSSHELLALPAGSPARTAFLVEQAVGSAAALNRRDFDAFLGYYEPEVELRIARLGDGGLWGGDFDELYRGHERFLEAARQWTDVWEDLRLEPDELIDEGGLSYVLFATWVGRGGGSGAEVTTSYQARHTVVGDRIGRVEFRAEREPALRELGLGP